MKYILYFLLLLITTSVQSQDNKKIIDYIHFAPSTYIEPNAYIRIGVSKDVNAKHNVQLDFGYGKNLNKNPYSRFYTRAMYKYYISKESNANKFYFFADVFYNKNINERKNSNYLIGSFVSHFDTTTYVTYTKANMHINKIGSDVGLGYLIKTYKNFYINLYAGLGLANRKVQYKNIENKKTELLPYQGAVEWFDNTRFMQEKSLIVLSCKGGFELVYKF